MALHQSDEQDPVSISLGNSGLFRGGEPRREGRTTSFKLASGDVVILGGEGRLCFHGVNRVSDDIDAAEERRTNRPDPATADETMDPILGRKFNLP